MVFTCGDFMALIKMFSVILSFTQRPVYWLVLQVSLENRNSKRRTGGEKREESPSVGMTVCLALEDNDAGLD